MKLYYIKLQSRLIVYIKMVNIENKILQKKLIYNGVVILKYKIEFPQIRGYDKFNLFNYTNSLKLQKRCEGELFDEAKKIYDYNKKNNYPIMVYEIVSEYLVTYNYDMTVSLYTDEYIFSGGAHGNTIRTSQTWKFPSQHIIELKEYFPQNPNYVSEILSQINSQIEKNIKKGNNYYFDNYCPLVASNFKIENFYLTNNLLAVFYQQYDIAPYSSGILSFYIKSN